MALGAVVMKVKFRMKRRHHVDVRFGPADGEGPSVGVITNFCQAAIPGANLVLQRTNLDGRRVGSIAFS